MILIERVKNMRLSELKTSDVVLSSKGSYGIVLRGTPKGDLIKWFKNNKGEIIHKYRSLDMIDDNLTFKFDGKDNRIIKVYRVTDQHDMTTLNAIQDKYLIWEEKIKEITMAELEAQYGCKVKVVRQIKNKYTWREWLGERKFKKPIII